MVVSCLSVLLLDVSAHTAMTAVPTFQEENAPQKTLQQTQKLDSIFIPLSCALSVPISSSNSFQEETHAILPALPLPKTL